MRTRGLWALMTALVCAFAAAPAHAAFPGINGKIAFTADPTDLNLDVWTMNADGSAQTNVSNDPDSDSEAAWSPSGCPRCPAPAVLFGEDWWPTTPASKSLRSEFRATSSMPMA